MKKIKIYQSIFLVIGMMIISLVLYNIYMNSYKVSKEINSKYLYYKVGDSKTYTSVKVEKDQKLKISMDNEKTITLSLLENSTIIVKWQAKFDEEVFRIGSTEMVDVTPIRFRIKEGESFDRRVLTFEKLNLEASDIVMKYGSFSFTLELTSSDHDDN